MANMSTWLGSTGLWRQVAASAEVREALEALQPLPDLPPDAADEHEGLLQPGFNKNPLGHLSLSLQLPVSPRAYLLTLMGPVGQRTGFRLAIDLSEGGAQRAVLGLLEKLPGMLLKPARKQLVDGQTVLEPIPGKVSIEHEGLWLVLAGDAEQAPRWTVSASKRPPDGLVKLSLNPPTVLLAESGFGLELAEGLWVDDSSVGRAGGVSLDAQRLPVAAAADTPAWHGLVMRQMRMHFPRGVPLLGGHAVDGHLHVGFSPTPGIDLVLRAELPADGDRPPLKVLIECRDPTATGIEGLVPTYAEIEMTLPWPRQQDSIADRGAFTVGGGKPVKARARLSRAAGSAQQAPRTVVQLALESQGPDGLLRVDSSGGEPAAKVVVAAATTASALAADGAGPALRTLLTAAVGLSSFLHSGKFVVHGATLMSEGEAAPVGGRYALLLDYSVDAVVDSLGFGPLQISMKQERPLKLRAREVRLTVDPSRSGLDMFDLDFQAARMEVEDPGGWQVGNLSDLFDVTGTRSGRGSQWFEIDLRFRIDLGPVRVSGATLRATFDNLAAVPRVSLRGLDAAVQMQPLISGRGGVSLSEDGFTASLAVKIVPLGLGAQADVAVKPPMVHLGLGVEFPGPLPLANSGMALYALGGFFTANGQPKLPAGPDPIQNQLDWTPAPANFEPAQAFSFGLEAVIGTAPDMGFSFSARAGLVIRTPEVAVRGALSGRVMGPRVGLSRADDGPEVGVRARGVVVIDPQDAVMVAVEGRYTIPKVLDVRVPFGARFPVTAGQLNQWFVHLGADGHNAPGEGRQMGPVRAVLLPGLLDQGADAYVMMRGAGITDWPRGESGSRSYQGFICAFGAGFTAIWGLKPIVWAEIHARADILLATSPLTLAGRAQVGGSLHVTIFSVGVDAMLEMLVTQGQPPWLKAEVCGHIELLFTTLRRCVRVEMGAPFKPVPPPPERSPLDGPQQLVDDNYQITRTLSPTREEAEAADAVWPDAIPVLTFGTAPLLAGLAAPQFPAALTDASGPRAAPQGSDRLEYRWSFTELSLLDVTDPAAPQPVPGPMSSSWLMPKFDDAQQRSQPAELALLTPDAGLWLNALSNAGSALPHDPLGTQTQICRLQVQALPGVAAGHAAEPWGPTGDVMLPPDPVSTNPLQSQPSVMLSSTVGQPGAVNLPRLDEAWAAQQAWPMVTRPAAYVALEPPQALNNLALREAFFPSGLAALGARMAERLRIGRTPPHQHLQFEAQEPLTALRLWLLWQGPPAAAPAPADAGITVSDEHGQAWVVVDRRPLANGTEAWAWGPPQDLRTRRFTATHRLEQRWGVLGVVGITDSARAAADAQNQALAEEAARQRTAAQQGPSTTSVPTAAGRCVLQPERVYELRARLHWQARLRFLRDGNEEQSLASGDAEHRWYWRTAPAATPANTPPDSMRLQYLRPWQKSFAPELLLRHVRGFEPAQSEYHRFPDDPAQVHFGVAHVGALLDSYGLEMQVRVRRVDKPAVPDVVKRPQWSWSSQASWMGESEQLRAAAAEASPCELPRQQASAGITLKLGARATYELGIEVKRKGSPLSGPAGTWLHGVTFGTSRWRDVREMQLACGFGTGGPGRPMGKPLGDVALRAPERLVAQHAWGDDATLQAWLAAQAMDGWPAPDQPRVSQLWRAAPGNRWEWVGVWLESPEPLHRPGRVTLGAWAVRSGNRTIEDPFDIQLSDHSGTRWLLARSSPMDLASVRLGVRWVNPRLRMILLDSALPNTPPTPPTPRTGWMELALQPSFAQEAL